MPPKRPASTAFKPPRPKPTTTASDHPTPKSRPNPLKSGGSTTRPRAKFIPAPPASSSSEDDDNDDENEDDEEEEDPSEQDPPSNNDASSSTTTSPAPAPPVRRIATASRRPGARPSSADSDPDEDGDDAPPVMPEKLLTALLYSHFQQAETKIGREARELVGKYVETFVREAVARAIVERKGVAGGGDFLEVEDLEKLAPQLILDF